MPKNKSWFRMAKKEDVAEIEIFDEIDSFWGIGPKEFKDRFDEVKGASKIKLLLNSVGGSIFDGMAIYNILATVKEKLEVEVIGLAASMASVVALSGSRLIMAEGSYFMIHLPATSTFGTSDELRKAADVLDKMRGEFVSIYKNKSGLSEEEIVNMMTEETWFTASEAIEKGFADDSEDYGEIAAKADPAILAKFVHVPKAISSETEQKKIKTPRELEDSLRDLGMSKSEAVALVAQWKMLDRRDSGQDRGEPDKSEIKAETPEIIKLRMRAEMALHEINL